MSILNRSWIGLAVVLASCAIAGCTSSAKEAEEARLSAVDTPLPHDPMDKFEIGPWWSDGTNLLNLRADGGYSVFADNNRYTRAIDRGRWGQQNYATLWLEPYTGLDPQRIRVAITRVDGRIALQPPKCGTMFEIAAPPPVMEDRLLGEWRGTMGSLTLDKNSTYAFAPTPGAMTVDGKVLAGHNGKWSLKGNQLTLTPATPNLSPMSLNVRLAPAPPASGEKPAPQPEPVLEGLGGELIHMKAASA